MKPFADLIKMVANLATAMFVVSCGLIGPDRPGPGPNEENIEPQVFPSVVTYDQDKITVSLCDTLKGNYKIDFRDEVPVIRSGSVVPVFHDGTVNIVLVTEAKENGKSVEFSGVLGNMDYVFQNTKFTLTTRDLGESDLAGNAQAYNPSRSLTETKAYDVDMRFVLWDKEYPYDHTFHKANKKTDYTSSDSKIEFKSLFHPYLDLDVDLLFEGVEEVSIAGVKFKKSKYSEITVSFNGSLSLTADLSAYLHMTQDFAPEVHFPYDPDDDIELVKHDLFGSSPHLYWNVAGVPIEVLVGCDAFAKSSLTASAELDFTVGLDAIARGSIGATYSTSEKKIVKQINRFTYELNTHNPTVEGHAKISGKFALYPHFRVWIDHIAGPAFDIKPYLRTDIGYSFSQDLLMSSPSDYMANTIDTYFGFDFAAGISTPLEEWAYEADQLMFDIPSWTTEWQIFKSPKQLILAGHPSSLTPGQKAQITYNVYDDLFGYSVPSAFFPIIQVENVQTHEFKYLVAVNGYATYEWIASTSDDGIVARIFDYNGKLLDKAEYGPCPVESEVQMPVDMGLSVAWGDRNTHGNNYYAWAVPNPIMEKTDWMTYKWSDGTVDVMTKYNLDDRKTIMDMLDDACSRDGSVWRTPSIEDWEELFQNCTVSYGERYGQKGCYLKSRITGNEIFLPLPHKYYDEHGLNTSSEYTSYWSRSRGYANHLSTAYAAAIYDDGTFKPKTALRYYGYMMRPVYVGDTSPELTLSAKTLDFGTLAVGDTKTLKLTISNTGLTKMGVTLSELEKPYSCSNTLTCFFIEPGMERSFEITFNPESKGSYNRVLVVDTNASDTSVLVNLIGTCVPDSNGDLGNVPGDNL